MGDNAFMRMVLEDENAALRAENKSLNLRVLALANSLALDHDKDAPTLSRLVTILKNKSLTDGGATTDPESNRYIRGRCTAFREVADMLQSMIDAAALTSAQASGEA